MTEDVKTIGLWQLDQRLGGVWGKSEEGTVQAGVEKGVESASADIHGARVGGSCRGDGDTEQGGRVL